MIWSVRNMAHVDFEALRGTQTVYKPGKNDSQFHKSLRQTQLDRNWENLNYKIDKREVIYTRNQFTVAAIITKHFITQAMRDKLSNETDWLDLKEDHVTLLKRMKTFMTITDETKWQHFGLMESLRSLANCTQKQNESVNDYRRRFEAQADQVFEILGNMHVYATKTMGYLDLYNPEDDPDGTKAVQETVKKEVLETIKASAFFYNCDRSRFQSMLDKANQTYAIRMPRLALQKKTVSTEDRGEMLMKKWQTQLEANSDFKDDDRMVSNGSVNMQIYKSTSKMDSLKHCFQWTKDNKKRFKSNGSKHWDINLGMHLDSGSTLSLRMNEDYAKPGAVSDLDYMFN
ncbi:unnamed protein product [Cylindrotheca closterium]|uniref:Uncharacterized protein n=1 Tax=Cylindrotheca closterium TaxID=2856 RepID=A0AAD2FP06_9STRA|nr:unnamed protein product [Cylindrotheca closterium]